MHSFKNGQCKYSQDKYEHKKCNEHLRCYLCSTRWPCLAKWVPSIEHDGWWLMGTRDLGSSDIWPTLLWIGSHHLMRSKLRHTHEMKGLPMQTTPPRLVWFVLPIHNLHTHTCHWPWAPLRIHTNCGFGQCHWSIHTIEFVHYLWRSKGDECVLVWHPFAKAIVKAWPCIHKPSVGHLQSSPWTLHVGPIVFEN